MRNTKQKPVMGINSNHEIEISWGSGQNLEHMPDEGLIRTWSNQALAASSIGAAEVSIRIVSSEEMTKLNSGYRGIDKPTNVLSFPMDAQSEQDRRLLGDIAICADVVLAEAAQQGKSNHAHFAHMLVHGVLHLKGFDHLEDRQAKKMEQLELEILHTMGFPDPYIDPVPMSCNEDFK